MKYLTALLALAATAICDQQLVDDLAALNTAIVEATYVVGNYTGTQEGYTGPDGIRANLYNGIMKNRIAYNYSLALAAAGDEQTLDESNAIIAEVAGPIETNINTAVAVLIEKAPVIDAAGFMNDTATILEAVSSVHDTLSLAVGAILDPATLPEAAPPVLEIDYQWRRSVVAFGGIPLAPLVFPEP